MQRKSEKRKIAADTSALISLAVGCELEECLKELYLEDDFKDN
ncbi:MAG: hypothetical protein ACOC5D_06100 [Thermoplasmatota archaeon]